MIKNLLVLGLLATTTLFSCSKNTAVVQTGTIRYTNTSSGGYRYEMFLDGTSLGLLSANKFFDKLSVPVGSHIVKGKQYEGYVLYPTVVEKTVNISNGITLEFSFP
jgi:hypothetical protein